MSRVNILGVGVDRISMPASLELVKKWLKGKSKHYIVTPNVEFILAASQDKQFREILNKADLAVADSARLGWAYELLNEKNIIKKLLKWPLFIVPKTPLLLRFDIVTGTDLMKELIEVSADLGFTIGFLGGREGVARKCAERLKEKYPRLKIGYALAGPVIPAKAGSYTNKNLWIPDQVRDDKVDILFVAFGQIKQEKWIDRNLNKIPVKVAMGVGGAFDYLSGEVHRAPKAFRQLGFEWLYRLIVQPWRIGRQVKLFKFLWLVLIS